MIRPEPVALGPAAESRDICLDAKLEEFFFVGNAIKYLLKIGAGTFIKARTYAVSQSNSLQIGDTVKVGWNREDMLLVDSE